MFKIDCLIKNGTSLTEEISELLYRKAQEILARKGHKARLRKDSIALTGEITTNYSHAMMGSISGIVFNATLDWQDGSTKVDFIVRPLKNLNESTNSKWCKVPFLPVPIAEQDPSMN